ncbi:MAG: hypothetical protein JW888_04540 [Pirellulales bacterium]|nr:hypothetical protein [Pirellulales bacterium]
MIDPREQTVAPCVRFLTFTAVVLTAAGLVPAATPHQPLQWQPEIVQTTTIHGRTVIRYEHDCLGKWGYIEPRRDYFYVILPEKPPKAPPLLVLLHSAGGSGEKELEGNVQRVVDAGPGFVGLVPNAAPPKQPDWWWGSQLIKEHPEKYRSALTPVENRVLATVDWVARQQNVDRNRIYLHGISMGGSGALGLGMYHGNVFAALCAKVPAGADHVMHRMGFPRPPADNASTETQEKYLRWVSHAGLPDAPPLVTFSSQLDNWSKGQESFMRALADGRHAVVFAWGPWGHRNVYERYHAAVYEFPWLEIRKNEAYPVFTHASTDDRYPGHKSTATDQQGQVNGFFRWKTLEDTPERFAIELRLVRANELSRPTTTPGESVADVTLRRLQRFTVDGSREYAWELRRQDKVVASGTVRPDAAALLTVPRLTITDRPAELVLR